MAKQTFINCSPFDRVEFRKKARRCLKSLTEDMRGYMQHGFSEEDAQTEDGKAFFKMIGDWFNYGLSVDYVSPGTFKNRFGYLRYQFSWGGPSDELRIYGEGVKVEYVYMDWGTGIGFDVTDEDWAKWLVSTFDELGTFEAEKEKACCD